MPASPFSFQYTPSGRRGKEGSFCTGRRKCHMPNLQDYFSEMQFGAVSYVRMLCGGGYHPPAQCGSTRRPGVAFVGATCGRPLACVSTNPWGATTSARHPPAGMPPGAGLPGRGTAFFPKESGGKERAGGVPPASPQTGAHGGGWLYGQGKNRACIAARFMGSHVSGAVAPWVARIAVTPQALGTCALYRVRPPGRRRCYASEKAWRFRRLGDAAADRMSGGRSRVVVRMQFCT